MLGLAVVVLKIALDPAADPVGLIDEGVAVTAALVGGFEVLPAAGGGRHVAQAVVADDHHAVFAVDGGTHLINIVHLVFDHALDPVGIADDPHAAVFDPMAEDKVVGVALDRAHDPLGLWIAKGVELEVDAVGAGVHHPGLDRGPQPLRLTDGSVGDHAPRLAPTRVKAALVADGQLDVVALGGDDHGLGLAQGDGHGLFAEHGLGPAGAGGDGHFRVLGIPRADADDVEVFHVEHLAVGEILFFDVEVRGVAGQGFGMRVGDGRNFSVLALGPTAAVLAGNAAGGNDADAIFSRHGILSA